MMKTVTRLLALTTILALPTWVEALPLPIAVDFEGPGAGVVPDGYGSINWNADWSGVETGGSAAATYYASFDPYGLGAFVHSSSLLYPPSIPTFLRSGSTNEFENVYFGARPLALMDDLTDVNKVPEPGMLLLVGLGLLGAAARARRRRT